MMILSVMLAVLVSAGTLAEQTVSGSASVPVTAEESVPDETLAAESKTGEQASLEKALAAFRALKGSSRVKDTDTLKEELDGFVKEGELTQKQADLILEYYTEQFTARGAGGKQKRSDEGQSWKKSGKRRSAGNAESGNEAGRRNKNRNGKAQFSGNGQNDPQTSPGTAEKGTDADAISGATEKKK